MFYCSNLGHCLNNTNMVKTSISIDLFALHSIVNHYYTYKIE